MDSNILNAIGIDPGIIIIVVILFMIILLLYMIKLSMKMSRSLKNTNSL